MNQTQLKAGAQIGVSQGRGPFRVAVDIGGTFTDAVLINEHTGEFWIHKALTTPADPSIGFFEALRMLGETHNVKDEEYNLILHATTVATNAILERRGARVGLIVTAGFRDIMEIGRQVRYELYNLQTSKPLPLLLREMTMEVSERIDSAGNVLVPLDEESVLVALDRLRRSTVEAIGVCFLHSYRNPLHERRATELIRQNAPGLVVVGSSELAPEIREYWRASTTVVTAYISPLVSRYLGKIESHLHFAAERLRVMQSSGGVMTAAAVRLRPYQLIESGPAAGVNAAAFFARRERIPSAISFDMGGTTAKVGLVFDGVPRVLPEWEVASKAGSGAGLVRASGYPVLGSVVDVVEIGAGGGSVAWVDSGGHLRVGPHSAGADPGPACYAKGGTQPTVSDADLLLGRLNAEYFLGGEMPLNVEAAKTAVGGLAQELGLPLLDAAGGIVELAEAAMLQAVRLVTVERGYDPAEFVMVAFGGAGPTHAAGLVQDLGVRSLLVPPSPGVMSALGMIVSDLRVDRRITFIAELASANAVELANIYEQLEQGVASELFSQGAGNSDVVIRRHADARYLGQSWRLTIDLPLGPVDSHMLRWLRRAFDAAHKQAYGFDVQTDSVELVSVGVTGFGRGEHPRFKAIARHQKKKTNPIKRARNVWFGSKVGVVDAAVYDRYLLAGGDIIDGPSIVEEQESTTVIPPGYAALVDRIGVLKIAAVG